MATATKPATEQIPNSVMVADAAWCELQAHWPDWSVDEALTHPEEMLKLAKKVRRQFPKVTAHEVLKSLINARKRSKLKPRSTK